jgi:hypothetical protein
LSATDAFFNLTESCPPEIKNCEFLRKQFKIELLKNKGCPKCTARALRNYFINKFKG